MTRELESRKDLVNEKVTRHDVTRHCEGASHFSHLALHNSTRHCEEDKHSAVRRGNLLNGLLRHFVPRNDGDSCTPQSLLNVKNLKTYRLNVLTTLKKTAFTLAEVLITLGVIGIVAVMTIPTVINNSQNKIFLVGLKKAYSLLSQVNEMVQIENPSYGWDNLKDDDTDSIATLFSYYKPYFKIAKDCGCGKTSPGCWSDDATKGLNNIQFAYSGEKYIGFNTCSVRLADGTNLTFDFWKGYVLGVDYDKVLPFFYVDVNGDKKPNTFGKDVFVLAIKNGNIVPAGIDNNSPKCTASDTSSNLSGIDCAAKVLQEDKISY